MSAGSRPPVKTIMFASDSDKFIKQLPLSRNQRNIAARAIYVGPANFVLKICDLHGRHGLMFISMQRCW